MKSESDGKMYSPSQIGAFVLAKMKETAGESVGVREFCRDKIGGVCRGVSQPASEECCGNGSCILQRLSETGTSVS